MSQLKLVLLHKLVGEGRERQKHPSCPEKSVQRREVKVCKDLLLLGCEKEGRLRRGEHGLEARELLVKITHVPRSFNVRQKRRFDSFR